jgi:SAM-dependent methyltransferase
MMKTRGLYKVEDLPVFQNRMHKSCDEARACLRGNVRLVENLDTGLIYNADFDPAVMVYDETYQNEQAVSPMFQDHLESMVAVVGDYLGCDRLLEIGCGKGRFLDMLLDRGFDVSGVDPTYEGEHPRVVKEYFSPELGLRGEGLILRHVLEHIQNPYEFLDMVRIANGNSGRIYIEVPCFDWICEQRNWFDIFYEHVNYFRLSDFRRMFDEVHLAKRVFGDQYLCIVAELPSLRQPVYSVADQANFPGDFLAGLPRPSAGGKEKRVVWGGASKGVIFSLLSERLGNPVDAVIDINPAKQGQYLPATGLCVSRPDEIVPLLPQDSIIYVMNPNYLPEIREMSGNAFKYVGVNSVPKS